MRWSDAWALAREQGPAWIFWRGAWEIGLRSGWLARRFPARPGPIERAGGVDGDEVRRGLDAARFFLPHDLAELRPWVGDAESALARGRDLLSGRMVLFSHRSHAVGRPPDWFRSPWTGRRWPADRHWTRVADLSADQGDIKAIWEIARFPHVFTLARAAAVSGDDRFAALFWEDVESWIAANPPGLGPHWRCGQEASLRLIAWLFGLFAFRRSSAATPERLRLLVESVRDHVRHIRAVHVYAARALRNNHALSEAVAVTSAGLALDFLPESAEWRRLGWRWLEREAWQILPDGAYVQPSLTYARLAAQLHAWMLAVAEAAGEPLPAATVSGARRLLRFLAAMRDRRSGGVPTYGPNDGSLLLPLSSCGYADYRPALNALSLLLGEPPIDGPGPWMEEAAWLLGARRERLAERPVEPAGPLRFDHGGLHRLDGSDSHGILRCGPCRHRPHQADMLHLDLWVHGVNVLVDPGTWLYNTEPRWTAYFTGSAAHNTVTVDGRDQMRRGARFLWHGWTQGRVLESGGRFIGWHNGYHPVRHTRTVCRSGDLWLIVDDLAGAREPRDLRLHWLVAPVDLTPEADGAVLRTAAPGAPELRLACAVRPAGRGDWRRGDETIPRGWIAPYYGAREPAWSYALVVRAAEARFATLIGPVDAVAPHLPLTLERAERLVTAWSAPGPAGA